MNNTNTHNKEQNKKSEEVINTSDLLKYLKERIKLRTKSIRSIDNYDNKVWIGDIPESENCKVQPWIKNSSSNNDEELNDKWIQIKKPKLTNAPKLPTVLEEWIDGDKINDPNVTLNLKETIEIITSDENNEEVHEVKTLNDNQYLYKIFREYLDKKWNPWSKKESVNRKVQDIYAELYTIYNNQKKLNETYEILLGVGFLTWKTPSGYEVKRHGLGANIVIDFDPRRGVITVMPSGINGFTFFEQDMLDFNDQIHGKELENIKEEVKELRFNIWGSKQVHNTLNSWLNYLSPQGKYFKDTRRHKETKEEPTVSFAPSIILRKRGHRNFIEFIDNANENILDKQQLTDLVKKFILPANKQVIDLEKSSNEDNGLTSYKDPYFPLPANDQQKKILTELERRPGILVEGPPGTGKSHTIANITTHLLAMGNKVLITSQGVRALKVLKDKFPEEIQSLCINVLGDDHKANSTLKESVEDINDRHSLWNDSKENIFIEELENNLKELKKNEVLIIKDLISIREQETKHHSNVFNYYSGTLSEIAKKITEEKNRYDWISHSKESYDDCPVTSEELSSILKLIKTYDEEYQRNLRKNILDTKEILLPENFEKECKDLEVVNKELEIIEDKQKLFIPLLNIKNTQQAKDSISHAKELIATLDDLEKQNSEWINKSLKEMFLNSSHLWKILLEQSTMSIKKAKALYGLTKDLNISGLFLKETSKLQSDIQSLINHLKNGKGFGFGPFKNKTIKDTEYLWSTVKIDGKLVKDLSSLETLLKFVNLNAILNKLTEDWAFTNINFHKDDNLRIAQFEDQLHTLQNIIQFNESLNKFKDLNTNEKLFIENKQSIKEYLNTLERYVLQHDKEVIEEKFRELSSYIEHVIQNSESHSINFDVLEAVKDYNTNDYLEKFNSLVILFKDKENVEILEGLLKKLKKAMPEQCNDFLKTYQDEHWVSRFNTFKKAWSWSQVNAWIERLTDPNEYERLEKNHTDLIKEKSEVIKNLASKKSWSNFFGPNGINEDQLSSLKVWAKLISAIGKGTGKYALKKTRAAKAKMQDIQEAIPCWVMPLYRVVENFKPGKDLFDVVIIDEASQSGPEAMLLFFLAKKIIIVGDDKQIAPENIQINENGLSEIGNKYLQNLPHNEIFNNRETSFFDIGEVRIGGRIRLREHFRCMPEIIGYNNLRYYKGQSLEPLRQFGDDRLEPIKTVFVKDGYREGKGQRTFNEREADQIVSTIQNCINDEKYRNKTIGVISLQGQDQAKLIQQKLISTIGEEKFEEHDIRCGDASSFQGDERDVIFLSMVIASNEPFGTLTKLTYARRYNVAVSRAKDQLWLFHSVELNELSVNCERAKLLSYCLSPDLEKEIEYRKEVPLDELVKPFDSLFEQRVYMKIIEKGYKVIPQFETYGRRIDLVIQGKTERLAVECDGDFWHGPEKHEDDISRQRDLERCGWVFWRIRESSFYRNQDASLENLWKMLEERGILPTAKVTNNDVITDNKAA